MKPVILDTGPSLNFLAVNQINLMHLTLAANHEDVLFPQEVATEIQDKSDESGKFAGTARIFSALVKEKKFRILESDVIADTELVKAMKDTSTVPLSQLLRRRSKDLGEIMAVAHAIKLRNEGHTVTLVIDDGGGRKLARSKGFKAFYSTPRILAMAGKQELISYAECRRIYERMRPSDGREPTDDGLPHWDNSGLNDRSLFTKSK